GHEHLAHRARMPRLDLEVRLLRLDLDQDRRRLDGVADADVHRDDVDLDGRHAHLGDVDVDHRCAPSPATRRTAAASWGRAGNASSSSSTAKAMGASARVTRAGLAISRISSAAVAT